MFHFLVFAALASIQVAQAQLSSLRGTIPGSLHQCEYTNLYFFDSGNARPLDVLFLKSSEVPSAFRSGTVSIQDALAAGPLLAIGDIETPDASQYNFTLQIAEGEVFELFAFLPDGSGKALSLTRTVTTPLPSASACLTAIPTTISGIAGGAAATTTSAPRSATTSGTISSSATTTSALATATATSSATTATATAQTVPQSGASQTTKASVFAAVIGAVGAAVELFVF